MTDGQNDYGNNERCTMRVNQDLYVTATYYNIESNYDYITIGSTSYRTNGQGPAGVFLRAGATVGWRSDGSVVASRRTFAGRQSRGAAAAASAPNRVRSLLMTSKIA